MAYFRKGMQVAPMTDQTRGRPEGSLADSAYERLRTAILKGDLRPNQRLVETDLADWLKVSRTPLRESLTRLVADGLVTTGRRAWVVREHTPQEIAEIHEVRAALEGMAAFLAAQRASDLEIQKIEELHSAQGRRKLALADRAYLVEYNDAFHEALLAASGSERLRNFARMNREFFFTYRIAKVYTDEQARHSVRGHDLVLKALKARDGDAAEHAMRDHILEARDEILRNAF